MHEISFLVVATSNKEQDADRWTFPMVAESVTFLYIIRHIVLHCNTILFFYYIERLYDAYIPKSASWFSTWAWGLQQLLWLLACTCSKFKVYVLCPQWRG